jgi:diacylglycerol kinase (ATP)
VKKIILFHNPRAGDKEHTERVLIDLIEKNGFECNYLSTKKKGWEEFETDNNLLAIAGGDGTVRKVIAVLLDLKLADKAYRIALLPLGTANNIAKTLGITGKTNEIVASWQNASFKKFDVGKIFDIPEENFFLESFGYGIFPYSMKVMSKQIDKNQSVEERIKKSLELLHKIILSYEPRYCKLEINGMDHSGKFLLAEIMNTKSIGPNLILSPAGNPGDGEMEVVLVPESDKEKFAEYVLNKINDRELTYHFQTIKAKNIRISWEGKHVHADDKIIRLKKSPEISIEIKEHLLEFLVPDE